jgi:hypothetical protein
MTFREESRWAYEAIGNQQEKRGDWNNDYIRAKSIYCCLHYDTCWLYLMNAVKKWQAKPPNFVDIKRLDSAAYRGGV